jgi:hypothetical protein
MVLYADAIRLVPRGPGRTGSAGKRPSRGRGYRGPSRRASRPGFRSRSSNGCAAAGSCGKAPLTAGVCLVEVSPEGRRHARGSVCTTSRCTGKRSAVPRKVSNVRLVKQHPNRNPPSSRLTCLSAAVDPRERLVYLNGPQVRRGREPRQRRPRREDRRGQRRAGPGRPTHSAAGRNGRSACHQAVELPRPSPCGSFELHLRAPRSCPRSAGDSARSPPARAARRRSGPGTDADGL